jgi:NAD(P)-dependent dehydrogenase (short-subunit alcohol dehydrogenase family)
VTHRFHGRLAVITGVGRIGQVGVAVARAFADQGAALALLDRTPGEVGARAAEFRAEGIQVSAHACDLADATQLAAVAAGIAAAHPAGVAALVCLAGGFGFSGGVADSAVDQWQRLHTINLTTAFLTTRAFLPQVRAARGAICYFASAALIPGEPLAGLSAYATAKAGVVTLMRTVAQEELDHGVRANALAPNSIRTGDNVQAMGESARLVERETVGEWVTFLCSDAAGPVTGQLIKVG